MASRSRGGGGGDGLRAARRRRIDDVRQLQQQRRRQVLGLPHHCELSPPQQEVVVGDMRPDQVDVASSRVPSSSLSKSPCSSTRSSRGSLKRQNMMQRRIEMRKQNEERERRRQQQQQQQQRQQAAATHLSNSIKRQDGNNTMLAHNDERSQNHPQHFQQHQPRPSITTSVPQRPQPKSRPRHRSQNQSILKNSTEGNLSSHCSNDHPSRPQNYPGVDSSDEEQPQQLHSGQSQPNVVGVGGGGDDAKDNSEQYYGRPPERRPDYKHYYSGEYNAQQQQPSRQYSRAQMTNYLQTNMPPPPTSMTIPSPPMLQRRQQFSNVQNTKGERRHSHLPNNDTRRLTVINQGVYNEAELELSGINRSSSGPVSDETHQNTNRLKKGAYDSPSDEWFGLNRNVPLPQQHQNRMPPHRQQASSMQQQQQQQLKESDRYQHESQLVRPPASQNRHRRPQPPVSKEEEEIMASHRGRQLQGALKDPRTEKHIFLHDMKNPQTSQHHHQYHQTQGPDRTDINQKYHNDSREIHYQRQQASRQSEEKRQLSPQQQQRQQAQHANRHIDLLTQQEPPQHASSSRPTVEHLGNRTEKIQGKNMYNGKKPSSLARHSRSQGNPPPQNNMPPNLPRQPAPVNRPSPPQQQHHKFIHHSHNLSIAGGDDSTISVSDQARRFEIAARVAPRRSPNTSPETSASKNLDDQTIGSTIGSVASLAKEWEEGLSNHKKDPTSAAASAPDGRHHAMGENSPFGIWKERANRLARDRRREQRNEQKRHIENRWMRRGHDGVKNLSLESKQGGGHHYAGQQQPQDMRDRGDGRYYGDCSEGQEFENSDRQHSHQHDGVLADGYQSEGPSRRRNNSGDHRHHFHDGYLSEGGQGNGNRQVYRNEEKEAEGQEVHYEHSPAALRDLVDDSPITVEDARSRLWDQRERLRTVMPQAKGEVQGRLPGHHQATDHGSPSSYSGSSGGLFKSKFVHAATLATQNHSTNHHHHQQQAVVAESNKEQTQQQCRQENRRNNKNHLVQQLRPQHSLVYSPQEKDGHSLPYKEQLWTKPVVREHVLAQRQQKQCAQQPQPPLQEFTSKKKFSSKKPVEIAVSSHYTDSTTETTDITTNPGGGSYISSSHQGPYIRKVSPSPPKNVSPAQPGATATASTELMPPIDEQVAAAPLTSQQTQFMSVADLIARINAVSRSNPEEALAAIDSIIKSGSGGGGNVSGSRGVAGNNNVDRSRGDRTASKEASGGRYNSKPTASTATQQQHLPPAKHPSLFSPSRAAVIATIAPNTKIGTNKTSMNKNNKSTIPSRHYQSKDSSQGKYEEILCVGSKRVLRSNSLEQDGSKDEEENIESGSALSSSGDSTISSMTNPTYMTLRSEQLSALAPKQPITIAERKLLYEHPDHLPIKPQKSWNTLRREYTLRKTGQPSTVENNANEFNPDGIELELQEKSSRSHEKQRQQLQQPEMITKSSTDEVTGRMGICGARFPIVDGCNDEERQCKGDDDPSTLMKCTNSDFGVFGNLNDNGNKVLTSQLASHAVNTHISHPWPINIGNTLSLPMHSSDKKGNNSHCRPDEPHFTKQRKNKVVFQQQQQNKEPDSSITGVQPQPQQNQPNCSVVPRHVSDAFMDVDIALIEESHPIEELSRRTTEQLTRQRHSPTIFHHQQDGGDDPQLQSLQSLEEEHQSSLQTISEAFSDVDASLLNQEQTIVRQRKEELEHLARPRTRSQDNEGSVNNNDGRGNGAVKNGTATTAMSTQEKHPSRATPLTRNHRQFPKKSKKFKKVTGEPALRLKGNKSLAQKFASLVKAYDD